MDRRLAGALLVVAVLVAAIVTPARSGLRMAGTAALIQLPGDPRVGDCLLGPAAEMRAWPVQDGRAGSPPASSSPRWSLPKVPQDPFAPAFAPCDGTAVAGEVVAIVSAAVDPQTRRARAQPSGLDCRSAGLKYAGLVPEAGGFAPPDQPRDDPVSWRFSINLRSDWVLPSTMLQAAGRTWAACVVAPPDGGLYRGRIADAYSSGRLPDEFGTCWDVQVVSAAIRPVDCGESHMAELISAGWVPVRAATSMADIKSSCVRLAADVLDRGDPTAAGALDIKTSPASIDRLDEEASVSVLCFVGSADRSLAGTLGGRGERAIPYAG